MLLVIFVLFLVFVVGIVIYFRLRNTEATAVSKTGISTDYKTFIDLLLSSNPSVHVHMLKENSLQVKDSALSFSLTKVEGRMIIVWTWISPQFGKRGKEWSFALHYDQFRMYTEIEEEIATYKSSLYQKYNLNFPSK